MSLPDPSSPWDEERATAELLQRVVRAPDAREAFSVALAFALAHVDGEPEAIVFRDGEEAWEILRGLDGGWPGSDQGRFTPLDDMPNEVERALRASAPVFVDKAPAARVGMEACVALQFTDAGDEPLGALFIRCDPAGPRLAEIGSVIRRSGPSLDLIRRRDRLEEQGRLLTRRNLLLARVNDALTDPVVLTDANNDILLANRRANRLLGSREGDSVGRGHAIRTNTFLFSAFLTHVRMSDERPPGRELGLVDPTDGSDLLFEVLTTWLPRGARSEDLLICVLRDITDLKRAVSELELEYRRSRGAEHRALRESQRLNAIIENAAEPILVTDEQSRIVLMNPEAERLFDLPEESAEPRRVPVWTNVTRFTSLVSDFLLQPDARQEGLLTLKDPETRADLPVRAVNTKITNRLEEPAAVVTVLRDLTEERENERLALELRKLNDELEERIAIATRELAQRNELLEWQRRELEHASRLKSEFLARMSHELRTPINAMLGYTSLLRERVYGDLTGEQETALDRVDTASEHLLALINDILDLARIEAGKMPVRLEAVRFQAVADSLSETIRPLVDRKGLEFRTEIERGLPTLRTDLTKLKQVLLNLLENAVKFTRAGWVALRAMPDDAAGIVIEVEDTGIGIAEDKLKMIFDDFRQVHEFSTREYGGTGLGLSISRKLLTLIGGTIDVRSTPGEGTKFVLRVPVELEERARERGSGDRRTASVSTARAPSE